MITITFSYPHNFNNLTQNFVGSKDGMMIHEMSKKKKDRIWGSLFNEGSCYVDMNRGRLVYHFLNYSQDSHLLMVDPDISFKPTILEEFDKVITENPHVGILAARVNIRNGLPVFYYQHEDKISLIHHVQPFTGVKEFDYVGTGIILLSREMLLDLFTKVGHIHFFNKIIEPGTFRILGDDLSFCKLARENGHKVYGVWDIEGIHHKDYPVPPRYPSSEEVRVTKR